MAKIIVIEDNLKTQALLVEHLRSGGFDVINSGNDFIEANFVQKKLLNNVSKFMIDESIFPAIPKLTEVFNFIESNYQKKISLKEVAQFVGYSRPYLTNLVGNLTGKTVNCWIIERRLARARNLLLTTNLPVEKIASDVGYQTVNHFFKQFRSYYNTSPKAWKQTYSNQVSY